MQLPLEFSNEKQSDTIIFRGRPSLKLVNINFSSDTEMRFNIILIVENNSEVELERVILALLDRYPNEEKIFIIDKPKINFNGSNIKIQIAPNTMLKKPFKFSINYEVS